MEMIVKMAMSTNGARQLNASPKNKPMGRPSTIEPLTPMETMPIARPRYFGSTILGEMIRQRMTRSAPLKAEIMRDMKRTLYVGLKIDTMFPRKKINKKTIVKRLRSYPAVNTSKIGPEMAKVKEKIVINMPACPRLT